MCGYIVVMDSPIPTKCPHIAEKGGPAQYQLWLCQKDQAADGVP
jgi:hypothetical protein